MALARALRRLPGCALGAVQAGPNGTSAASLDCLAARLTACAAQLHGWRAGRSFGSSAGEPGAASSSSRSASSGSGDASPSSASSAAPSTSGYAHQRQPGSGASTVNQQEAEKFAALAGQWWDPAGPFAPLHAMNPVRCRFLRSALAGQFGRDASAAAPLAGLRLLDVGCGGGLLAEALARMGAHVTGIDVNEGGLEAARAHARLDPDLAGRLQYRATTAEQLAAAGEQYDAVVASEVIEHVASLPAFCAALDALTRPGGGVAVSTLNRTPRSYALAVVAAEHLLRWVPPGTHDWTRFVTPEELVLQMEESTGRRGDASQGGSSPGGSTGSGGLRLQLLAGMQYNPLTGGWSLGRDTGINYIAWFAKQA
ncbi:ubiquinone biosynthesis O- mitochondrial [Chlorella sorokiniana]|uniref:Ubiquinone biosynthesis O-methyltransferase, mitochondrial n=1 Tax=Chlorella sorokiniana TaxID=3076 RepID=A0A2P6TBT8_CHLSO|nr:ubiquinone biosynthesis O- mitochondrial [Chlorella sorokiniana]|eukprot:PRW18354.1 ubiquinone biosynthesis O- mitochondrial [Chlorella sorokiniana]